RRNAGSIHRRISSRGSGRSNYRTRKRDHRPQAFCAYTSNRDKADGSAPLTGRRQHGGRWIILCGLITAKGNANGLAA
ncbi:MAG TPA: hypothetical protein VFM11_07005, partial [Burkholderiales bacterium]|nr:hypothetical protein [Burkholderiales bacterium]